MGKEADLVLKKASPPPLGEKSHAKGGGLGKCEGRKEREACVKKWGFVLSPEAHEGAGGPDGLGSLQRG